MPELPHFHFIEDSDPCGRKPTDQIPSVMILKGHIVEHVSFSCKPFFPNEAALRGVVDDSQRQSMIQLLHSYMDVLNNVGLTLANTAAIARTLLVDPSDHRQAQGDTQSFIAQSAYDFWCYIHWMSAPPKILSHESGGKGEEFDRLVKDLGSILSGIGYDLPQDTLDDKQVETATLFQEKQSLRGRGLGVTNQRRISML
jgi:hypothetical protein